jgi:Abnormal spindle-like microcephaly-assoc'd, ASPM-SPD-2-Hydin
MKKYALAVLAASISAGVLAGNFIRVPSPNIIGILSSHPATANLPPGGPGPVKPDPVGVGTLEGIDFGSVTTGTRVVRSAVLRNTGEGTLAGISTYVQGAGFSLADTTCGGTLAAGSACDINVALVAEGMSSHGGSVVVSTSVGEFTAALKAQGLKGELVASTASRAFGNVQVGESGTTAAITLTNSGNEAVTGVSFAPPAGYSVAANDCGSSIDASASCSFAVRFAPTAVQAYPGSLGIISANGGALDVALTGAGVKQAATLSHLAYGSRAADSSTTLQSTLTNTGVGPLSVTVPTAASVTGANFAFVSTTCGTSIAVGATCATSVRYSALGTAPATGTLTLVTGAGTAVANLSGQSLQGALALSAPAPDFGKVQVGETKTSAVITLANSGNQAITGLTFAPPLGYTLTGMNCPAVLAANASCAFSVTFAPVAAKAYPATMAITAANAPAQSVALSGEGVVQAATLSHVTFGAQAAGTASTLASTLTNTGIGPLSVTVPTAASVQGAGFSFAGTTCAASLPVGNTCTISTRYTASGVAGASGTLTVETGAGTAVANLTGQSLSGVLASNITSRAYGNVQVGQTVTSAVITLSNSGNTPVTGLDFSAPAGFSVVSSNCAASLAASSSCTFAVRFAPTATQVYDGNLNITSANGGTQAIALNGGGVKQAATLSHVAFGNVAAGTSPTLSSTLTNTGAGPLSITVPAAGSVAGNGFSFAGTTCGTSLAVGNTCTVSTRYSAIGVAAASGTLTIETGAGTAVANLSGQSLSGVLASNITSRAYGNVQVGETVTSAVITLSNSGNTPVTGLDFSAPAGFSVVSSNCAASLAASSSCTFAVRFAPTATQGYDGNLNITSANGGTQAIALNGAGVKQAATLSHVAFGDVAAGTSSTLVSTLTNTGSGPLAITIPDVGSVSGSGSFSYVGTTCGTSLAVGNTCTVSTRYSASGVAAASGTLTIETGAGTAVANLSGQSVSGLLQVNASSYYMGQVQVGQTAQSHEADSIMLRNSGNAPVNGIAFSSPEGYSVIASTCTTSLAANSTCSFSVRFAPTAPKSYTGNLNITWTNGATKSIVLSGSGVAPAATLSHVAFGSRAAGSSTTLYSTLTNTGIGPLSVTVPTAANVTGANFAFASTTCGTSVAAGANCVTAVRFNAIGADSSTGTLSIATDAGMAVANLTGQSQQAALQLTLTANNFGNIEVGKTSGTATFSVKNTGNAVVAGLAITSPDGFALVSNGCGTALAIGGSCTGTIRFAPTAGKSYSDVLRVTATNATYTAAGVTGTGTVQQATLTSLDYGITENNSASLTATLTNTGTIPLNLGIPTFTGRFTGNYSVCSGYIAVGASCTYTVTYVPSFTVNGPELGTVTIPLGTSGSVTANLKGEGYKAILVPSGTTDFGSVAVSTSKSSTITMTNTGNYAATLSTITSSSARYVVSGSTCVGDIPAKGSCTFNVTFRPTARATVTSAVRVPYGTGAPTGVTYELTFTGTGV